MKEVEGTQITVTKKATVIKLDQQPTVINNNQQEIFSKAPGLLITEQQTPGQFNFSYRGLGNPQESEFLLALQNRVPMATDWIGFPTLYYTQLPQRRCRELAIRAKIRCGAIIHCLRSEPGFAIKIPAAPKVMRMTQSDIVAIDHHPIRELLQWRSGSHPE